MNNYFEILDINASASLQEIKLAYRQKAKQYHPDINNSPGASDQFMKINEAYIILSQNITPSAGGPEEYAHVNWVKEQKRYARERATEYAKMKYEEYINSPIYKASKVLNPIFRGLLILFALFVFFSPIIFITYRFVNNLEIPPQNYTLLAGSMVLLTIVIRVIYKIIKYQL